MIDTSMSLIMQKSSVSRSLSALDVIQCRTNAPQFGCIVNICPLYSQSGSSRRSVSCGGNIPDGNLCGYNYDLENPNSIHQAAIENNMKKSSRFRVDSTVTRLDQTEASFGATHINSIYHKCHCRACCSCSPVDRLRSACLGYEHGAARRLHQHATSIDSGLEKVVARESLLATQRLGRKSEAAAGCNKCDDSERFSVALPYAQAGSAMQSSDTVTMSNLVASSEISDACQSLVDEESDDQDVFLPRVSSILTTDKVPALEFRQKFELFRSWFNDFSDEQRNVLLTELTEQFRLPQVHLLSVLMVSRMHAGCPPNCEDHLARMPEIISLKVLSLLDAVSLCRSSVVCRRWYQMANEQLLWQQLCRRNKWGVSQSSEQKQYARFTTDRGCNWKGIFAERYRLQKNWFKSRCHVRTFEGHTQGVSCVQFDETRIVSGSSDKTIKLWNIRTNSQWAAQTLVGHSGTVRCLHLDGNRLVSGSSDCMIKVWDLSAEASWTSVACKVTMTGHVDTVRCLQVDEDKVISGSYDTTLKIWDLKTGHCRQTLRGHQAAVLCVQFDSEKIISGSCDKSIKVWTYDGACVVTLQGHQDAVTCLQFDSTRIITGSLDRTLRFWDMQSWQCVNIIDWKASEGHTGVIRCLQADSWRVVSASDDKTIKVWSLETGKRLVTLRNHTDGVTCLQFNDSVIVSGSYDKTVKLWDFSCC